MKKIIKLSTLICCFLMVAAAAVYSQDALRNNTGCTWEVKIAYGDLSGCDVVGTDYMVVGPYQQVNFPNSNGMEILYAKGRPFTLGTSVQNNCAFYLSQTPCGGIYPQTYTNNNPQCCDGYTVSIFTGFGIYITN